jgi:hypothetical protein
MLLPIPMIGSIAGASASGNDSPSIVDLARDDSGKEPLTTPSSAFLR